jgi:hypothetical protein
MEAIIVPVPPNKAGQQRATTQRGAITNREQQPNGEQQTINFFLSHYSTKLID